MVALLAVSCAVVVANIYYVQPLIGLIGPDVHMSPRAASLIMSCTQLGYAAGLLLLVPLGDIVENRRLVVCTIAACMPPLLLAGLARSGGEMLLAGAAVGVTSVAVQMLVPLAAHMAPEQSRGRVVGTVMSGLLMGILLARPVSSAITAAFGWRVVFFLSAGLMAALALLLRRTLPRRAPDARQGYGALLASLFALPFKVRILRQRGAVQSACFAAFSLFWTGAPLFLAHDLGFTQRGIALFGLAGAAGALVAPIAGSLADRGHGRAATYGGLASIAVAFGVAWAGGVLRSALVLALAAMLLDAGVQTSLIVGQRAIYAEAAELRSRLNGLFIAMFFVGGAAGSAVTGALLLHGGWSGLCDVGVVLPLLALGYCRLARL